MPLHARWIKILKDMWDYKSRSILVILSIAVGVAAVGMISGAAHIIRRDLYGQYRAGNPAHLTIYTSPFEGDELVSAVEGMREVEIAEARRSVLARALNASGEWDTLELHVIPDYHNFQLNHFTVEQGASDPGPREIILERQSAAGLGVGLGATLSVEMPDERRYELLVAGIAHDVYHMPYNIQGEAGGYVSMDTLEWLGQSRYYNRLEVRVTGDDLSKEHVLSIGETIRDRVIEPGGYAVGGLDIPGIGSDPGDHWAENAIDGLLLILQIMAVMTIFLSAGLVINTITAILVQQVKQIGIMRSVGAVRGQIVGMYLVNLLIFSLLGLVVALPLGMAGAWWLANFGAHFINFDLTSFLPPPYLVILEIALGLLMPVLVAVWPILGGTRISIYEAIYQYGLSGEGRRGWVQRALTRLRTLNPAVLLSLRNTFRNRTRLAFTLVTLTLAGATFMAAFSTRSSLNRQIADASRYAAFDAALGVPGVNRFTAEREALRIPGVTVAETWARTSGVRVNDDDSESEPFEIVGLPPESITIKPILLDGRWLEPGDADQVVINDDLAAEQPDLRVGSTITLKVEERKHTYTIVGITSKHLSGGRVYMAYDAWGRLTGRQNQADVVRVRADQERVSAPRLQDQIADLLEERFENAGLTAGSAQTQHDFFGSMTEVFDIILLVLIIMAGILAVVGGLGLTGTMGINVMERTREIGVLRAVGASNFSVRQVVVIEGVAVGLISWGLSALLSVPSGRALSAAVIAAVLQTDATYDYSWRGLGIWLGIVVLIGVLSSLAPARRAVKLTVREVLDYE